MQLTEHGEIELALENARNEKKKKDKVYTRKKQVETASPFLECFDNVTDVLLLNVSADAKIHL